MADIANLVHPARTPVYTLGERLAKSRRDAGLEQADLAAMLGVSVGTISRWERNMSKPDVEQARAWAQRTQVRLDWIAGSTCFAPSPQVHPGQGTLFDPDRWDCLPVAS